MFENEKEWLNCYRRIGASILNLKSKENEKNGLERDIKELSSVIQEVEGPDMLRTILIEHIEIVVRRRSNTISVS